MSLSVISETVVENKASKIISQSFRYSPDDENELKRKGELFVVISQAFQSSDLGYEVRGGVDDSGLLQIFGKIKEQYYQSDMASSFDALKDVVEKVVDEIGKKSGGFEISAVVFVKNALYISSYGNSKTFLFRNKRLVEIIKKQKQKVISASGHIKENDLIILGTGGFFDEIPKEKLENELCQSDFQIAVRKIDGLVQSEKSKDSFASCFLKFYQEPKVKRDDLETQSVTIRGSLDSDDGRKSKSIIKKFSRKTGELKEKISGKRIYVKREDGYKLTKRKKTSLSIGLILIFILAVSIFFGIRKKELSDFKASYQEKLDQAGHELEEARNIFPISSLRARELFVSSKNIATELKNEGIDDPKVGELLKLIEQEQGRILGEYHIDPELFVDLALLSSGFNGDLVSSDEGEIFIADSSSQKIAKVSIDTKRSEIVVGPNLIDEINDIAGYSEEIYMLEGGGVYDIGERKRKVIEKDWEGSVLIHAYAGNIYMLEKSSSKIYRFIGLDDGFSKKRDWLSESVEVNLSNARSWVIDGAIWVLTDSGQIYKFLNGNLLNFKIKGVFPDVDNINAIYTNEELESLYLLDASEGRVVVITKEGEYIAQYLSEKIKNAKNLVVSEEERKVILLTGEKLEVFQLEHLE